MHGLCLFETIVEGDPKAPLSIATTPMFRRGAAPFPGLLHFTLDPYVISMNVKQGGSKFHFWVLGMTRLEIELWFPEPLVNTLPIVIIYF